MAGRPPTWCSPPLFFWSERRSCWLSAVVWSRELRKSQSAASIIRRTIILFALGVVVNGFPHFPWATLRIYGVLQRIALCYLCAGLLYLWRRDAWSKIAAIVVLLVGYYILMRYVPVPGAGVPTRDIPLLDPTRTGWRWLDRKLLYGRLYEGVRDPEGLLSTFPAIATALLGVLAGLWIKSERPRGQIAGGLFVGRLGSGRAGRAVESVVPDQQEALDQFLCAIRRAVAPRCWWRCLYWCMEVKEWRRGWRQPWIVFGTNAIFAYMVSELLASTLCAVHIHGNEMLYTWIYTPMFSHIHPVGVGSLLYSMAFTGVCWLVTYPLWRKKIFLRI